MHQDWRVESIGGGAFQVVRYTLEARKAAEEAGTGRALVWRSSIHPMDPIMAACAHLTAAEHAKALNALSRPGKAPERPVGQAVQHLGSGACV